MLSLVTERVQHGYTQLFEVTYISSHDGKPVDDGNGGDQGILHERIGSAVHQPSPFPKDGCIKGQYAIGGEHLFEPSLQFVSFGGVLFSGDRDTRLNLADGDSGQMNLFSGQILEPGYNGLVWTRPAQFRDDVGVEKVHGPTRTVAPDGVETVAAAGSVRRCEPRAQATTP